MFHEVRWLRVVVAAFLVELGLTVTTVPFMLFVSQQAFLIAIPIACFAVAYVIAFVATRKLPATALLHGVLIGVVATLMYFALVIGTSSVGEAAAMYGVPMFVGVNALRVIGAVAGGYAASRRSPQPA